MSAYKKGINTTRREFVRNVAFGAAGMAAISAGSIESSQAAAAQSSMNQYGKALRNDAPIKVVLIESPDAAPHIRV